MSSPFFSEPQPEKVGVFFYIGPTCHFVRFVAFLFKNPSSSDEGFFVL